MSGSSPWNVTGCFDCGAEIYRAAAGVYARIGAGTRYGGVSDLRTPGDYARRVNREQEEMAAEDHRGSSRPSGGRGH